MNQEALKSARDFEHGNAHFRNGNYDEAIVLYQQALQKNNNFSHYHKNLAKAFHHLGKHAEANAAEREARNLEVIDAHLQPTAEEEAIRWAIETIQIKLFSLGFSDHPLAELKEIADSSSNAFARSRAARELTLWHMHQRNRASYQTALEWLAVARTNAPNIDFRSRLSTLELLCRYHLSEEEGGLAAYARAIRAGEITPDLMLARANYGQTPEARTFWINKVLQYYGMRQITLLAGKGRTEFDQIICTGKGPEITDGPRVSVLIAAYDAADTLPTALRSLQEQTWKNLEIIVLDDCSPTADTQNIAEFFAATDSRIRVVRMQKNGGAYAARNYGLDIATGEFITLHDADDWSHPQKIETQVQYMLSTHGCIACTSEMFRAEENLRVGILRGDCSLISSNTSSLMFRREPIVAKIGHWDNVRFGADGQMMRRIKMVFKKDSLHHINTGPLSFQRYTNKSITADPRFGYAGFKFGVRRAYESLSALHFKNHGVARFSGVNLETIHYAPKPLRTAQGNKKTHYDVIIASDFRFPGGTTSSNAEEVKAQKRYGFRTGLVELYSYTLNPRRDISAKIMDLLEPKYVELVVFGEEVSCDVLIIRQPMALDPLHRLLPRINTNDIRIIINQPPRMDYGDDGRELYSLRRCHNNVEKAFGSGAIWHPIGPVVRNSLVEYHSTELQEIKLSDQDWTNIIDDQAWKRSSSLILNNRPIRICRHSRDSYVKWPDKREVLEKAYPNANDIEVHVLGGADTPKRILGGRLPKNWHVYQFGAMHPKEFLAQHDIFVYFTHPGWIESFGRVIFEAMAVGLPVLLPRNIGYEKLFGDAAIYISESEVESSIRRIMMDSSLYESQIQRGYRAVKEKFAYSTHNNRLEAIMNGSQTF